MSDAAFRERADAARNRERVLCAARRLFAERGVEAVSMSDIALAAGVGKGTLYRRFPDKGALCGALIDAQARAIQDEVLTGMPSAGRDAGPRVQLERLLDLISMLVDEWLEYIAVQRRDAHLESPAYAWMRMSVRALLLRAAEAGELRPGADVDYLADALLAPLAPDVWAFQRRVLGMPADRLRAGLRTLIPAA